MEALKKQAKYCVMKKLTNTTDEFLVKKKQPLVLPPEFDKIPEPGSIKNRNINEKENIKKILKAPKENIKRKNSSNIEKSIIEKIQK